METSLPPEISVNEILPHGALYVLPGRRLGPLKLIGLIPAVFGLGFAGAGVKMIVDAIQSSGGVDLFMAVFGVPFALAGGFSLMMGLMIIGAHTEVLVTETLLKTTEKFAFIRWPWSRPVEKVSRFKVIAAAEDQQGKYHGIGFLSNLCVINVECDGANPMFIAPGYPKKLLVPLAEELSARCNVEAEIGVTRPASPEVEVISMKKMTDEDEDRFEQPADSDALFERHDNGITITVAPRGILSGSNGLFFFAIIWLVFSTSMFGIFFFQGNADLIPMLFMGFFILIGISMLVGAVYMGRKQAVLAVLAGQLLVLNKSIFGKKQEQWPADQIASIQCAASGMEVNNRPLHQLQIHLADGTKTSTLTGRDTSELQWMATMLRQELGRT